MRVFLTGVTGFAGSHLADSLLADGAQVFGLVHGDTSHWPMPSHNLFHPITGDLLDLPALTSAIGDVRPDVVYHLAGQASPTKSWDNPALTMAVNAGGTANILEAARAYGYPRVVVVSSAEIYGQVQPDALPITERSLPRPHHPYGVSKWAAGQLVHLYWQRYRLPAIEARPFNHIGPRQALGFVVPDFASQLAAIKLGLTPAHVSVGNLDAERDFTDVRDVVRAYRALPEMGSPGETYLICSGKAVSIRTVLETLIAISGCQVQVKHELGRARPSETPRIVGSYAKLKGETGWRPEIGLETSLTDSLNEWIARYSLEGPDLSSRGLY